MKQGAKAGGFCALFFHDCDGSVSYRSPMGV